jgi:S-adenosylmethionine:tRNA ribosyltransferase-isomerase
MRTIPTDLYASAPPDDRGEVRLMVARPGHLEHAVFCDLDAHLEPGDLVVVNTSRTLPAAVPATRQDGSTVVVHFSTPHEDGSWVVELRAVDLSRTAGRPYEVLDLPGGVRLRLVEGGPRLWAASVAVEGDVVAWLHRVGRPIRYGYLGREHPLEDYQTVFALEDGSAEMPSAARPFTADLVTRLVRKGVLIAPLTLHCGVSSLEAGEPPLPERWRVPPVTARLVESTRTAGSRVVAAGTTVTRALETAAEATGVVRAGAGWTELVLGPDRPARVVTGLITGWHDPQASHLGLLQAVAGSALVEAAYEHAVENRYRWHEFGDSCLLLP